MKNSHLSRKNLIVSILMLASIFFGSATFAQTPVSKTPTLDFVNKIASLNRITPLAIETLVGKKLSPAFRSSDSYTANDIKLEDTTIELLDYRAPQLLVLRLKDGCILRATVLAAFKPLKITGFPSGHSAADQTYFSKTERWGELAFGFPENNRECLKTVVFTMI
jgi:hypothetical protein